LISTLTSELPIRRDRGDLFQLLQLLNGALDDVGHLLGDLVRQGAGIGRTDDGLSNDELRVFEAPEFLVSDVTARQDQEAGEPGDGLLAQRVLSEIHRVVVDSERPDPHAFPQVAQSGRDDALTDLEALEHDDVAALHRTD
jgi:hypothetical protein